MDSLELIINLSIIILLIPTIIYAYKLNKNLSLLRQNQKSLSQLISSLNEQGRKLHSETEIGYRTFVGRLERGY